MSNKGIIAAIVVLILCLLGFYIHQRRHALYSQITSPGINYSGGDITITNAKIWTGVPNDPWKSAMTVRNGKIVAMNADIPAGRIIDAGGRLVVPGFWDGHCHPQTPFVLSSYDAPMLFDCKTKEEVLQRLSDYVKSHPNDKYPRMFGWLDKIFEDGEKPTRHMIDEVVSDRPVYLVHCSGHSHWANTKALELAGVLENDPGYLRMWTGNIHRDPETGIATGLLEETELASTHGLLLESVRKVEPMTFDEKVLVQTEILKMYSPVGITGIWTKDGDIEMTRIYEQILRNDALPVRAVLDNLYTYWNKENDFEIFAQRAKEIDESGLPKDFIKANGVKLLIDLPYHSWLFEPYADRPDFSGHAVYEMDEIKRQVMECDRLGLHVNLLTLGDRAVHEGLNLIEQAIEINGPKDRRWTLEHADVVKDSDLPRIKELGAVVVMNPIGLYPDEGYIEVLRTPLGEDRFQKSFEPWKKYVESGVVLVNGSDFPLAPMDPIFGMNILVNGTDVNGNPEGGFLPHKCICIEDALRSYTTNAAYNAFMEDRLGYLKPGYYADFAMLSENILDPNFAKEKLLKVKINLTVMNGHVLYEDFTDKEKVIEFSM